MKITISIFILMLVSLCLHAEDGHSLWLRGKSTGPVKIICSESSATIDIAKQELEQSWQDKSVTSIALKIKSDPLIQGY
jgi:alpha-glucuronidase